MDYEAHTHRHYKMECILTTEYIRLHLHLHLHPHQQLYFVYFLELDFAVDLAAKLAYIFVPIFKMELKLVNCEDIILCDIIFRKPQDFSAVCKFVEMRYQQSRIIVPTPRLRIVYGLKNKNYCVSLVDRDLDSSIMRFYQFVIDCDRLVVDTFRNNVTQWCSISTPTEFVFRPSIIRKSEQQEYMPIKLLYDKNILLTQLYFSGAATQPVVLSYGNYALQYVELSGVWISENKFGCLWVAHQISVSPHERVFLRKSVLSDDRYTASTSAPAKPVQTLGEVTVEPTVFRKPCTVAHPHMPLINPDELLKVKNQLKKIN